MGQRPYVDSAGQAQNTRPLTSVTLFGGRGHGLVFHDVVLTVATITVPIHYPCGCTGQDVYQRISDVGLYARHALPAGHIPPSEWDGPPLEGDEWMNNGHA